MAWSEGILEKRTLNLSTIITHFATWSESKEEARVIPENDSFLKESKPSLTEIPISDTSESFNADLGESETAARV